MADLKSVFFPLNVSAPSIDIPFNGTAYVVGGGPLTPQCLLAYENEFTFSAQTAVTMANLELEAGNLCGQSAGIHVMWEDSEMNPDQTNADLVR